MCDLGKWQSYITACAERSAPTYDERQDLISDTMAALLEYKGPIRHPRGFIRTTVTNLAINRKRIGAGAWEQCDSDIGAELDDIPAEVEIANIIIIRDTLGRLLEQLTPAQSRCYDLLRAGYDQRDLPERLGVSRQAVSKLLAQMRRKFEELEAEDSGK